MRSTGFLGLVFVRSGKLYFYFRWKLLREPQGEILGTEKDEHEDGSYHLMITKTSEEILAVGRVHKLKKESNDMYAQIRYMAVSENHRREGLGTTILNNLEQYAFNNNVNKIILHAREGAIDFYKKNGYEVIKKTHILYNSIQHWMMLKNNNISI